MASLTRPTARIPRHPLRLGRRPSAKRLAAVAVLAGFAGWVLENASYGPRYSRAFGGLKVPFLPVWALSGLATSIAANRLRAAGASVGKRAAVYAGLSTLVEFASCELDRATGGREWDYTGETLADRDGCVSLSHTALWTGLAFAAEPLS